MSSNLHEKIMKKKAMDKKHENTGMLHEEKAIKRKIIEIMENDS